MEAFSALLVLCVGNSPVTGEFPTQRSVTLSFDVFFDQRLNKRLSKQSRDWWFETPSRSLWRHCNVDAEKGGSTLRVWLQMAFLRVVMNYFDPFSTTPSKYKHIKKFSVVISSLVFYVYSSYPKKHIHTVFVCLALLQLYDGHYKFKTDSCDVFIHTPQGWIKSYATKSRCKHNIADFLHKGTATGSLLLASFE